ncbi:MAG: molecular chaperone DnaK [Psychromonas sp.]|nr:molecular chaperone DnaK [Psychromonas sp.]
MAHLSEAQLKQFQTELSNSFEKLRQEIIDISMSSSDTSIPLTAEQLQTVSADELIELAGHFEIPSVSHKIALMKCIDAALNNLQIGMFGLCADCESEIAINDLNLDPTRQRCTVCDKKYRQQKNKGYKL